MLLVRGEDRERVPSGPVMWFWISVAVWIVLSVWALWTADPPRGDG